MRYRITGILWCMIALATAQAVPLELRIQHTGAGNAYLFNRLAHATKPGTPFLVSRLSYFVAQPRLQKANGSWVSFEETFAVVNGSDGDGRVVLDEVPPGEYTLIEWQLGLPPEINHSKPGAWPAGHPLNPSVNNLHWTWQDGYIFLALEGKYRDAKGQQPGFVYHVANDAQHRTVQLHCKMSLNTSTVVRIEMDVPTLFEGLDMLRDGASTHSREGDVIAPAMADRAARAFRLLGSEDGAVQATKHVAGARYPQGTTPVELPLGKGVPQPAMPLDNPLTEEGIALGEKLFFDKILSRGEIQDCSSCHHPDTAFADTGNAFSLGVREKEGVKNSMALFNLAWHDRFFWDGRSPTLRDQVLHPIQDPLELDETLENVEAKLKAAADYPPLFEKAFGTPGVSIGRMALAMEQYLMSILSFDAHFDRSSAGKATFTESEQRGLQLFLTEFDPARGQRGADCFHCHGGFLFTNNRFFNNGLDEKPEDGFFIVSGDPQDVGKFKAPSLRNVAVTGPYMHDGRFETLEEVVEHYNSGVKRSKTLDANLAKHPVEGLGLSAQEKADLVAFLKTLTDQRFLP